MKFDVTYPRLEIRIPDKVTRTNLAKGGICGSGFAQKATRNGLRFWRDKNDGEARKARK